MSDLVSCRRNEHEIGVALPSRGMARQRQKAGNAGSPFAGTDEPAGNRCRDDYRLRSAPIEAPDQVSPWNVSPVSAHDIDRYGGAIVQGLGDQRLVARGDHDHRYRPGSVFLVGVISEDLVCRIVDGEHDG